MSIDVELALVLGLFMIGAVVLASGSLIKAIAMIVLGLLLGLVVGGATAAGVTEIMDLHDGALAWIEGAVRTPRRGAPRNVAR